MSGVTIASVIDHVGVNVADYAVSRRFYEHALEPLGYRVLMAFDEYNAAGFGQEQKPVFWVAQREPLGTGRTSPSRAPTARRCSASTRRRSRPAAADNGPPGLREHYHSTYYSAFVLDPDGNNVEAVCHRPE